jgi:D-3-phosphoglycerate dehydrogenase
VLAKAHHLKVICTASTGTNHIDKEYAKQRGIAVLSLTTDMDVIGKISSTAELAFGLMLAALRYIPAATEHVKKGKWDYTKFIGRQLDFLTIGVVGYGRLGTFFTRYARAFGSRVLVYDPYVKVKSADKGIVQVHSIDKLLTACDVIALHVHVTPETTNMVNKKWFTKMKKNVVLVNTSRGEIINEKDLLQFLTTHPQAMIAADVIAGEIKSKTASPLRQYAKRAHNALLTPHIGGMTIEGQTIAYGHAAKKLANFFKNI